MDNSNNTSCNNLTCECSIVKIMRDYAKFQGWSKPTPNPHQTHTKPTSCRFSEALRDSKLSESFLGGAVGGAVGWWGCATNTHPTFSRIIQSWVHFFSPLDVQE